MVAVALDATPLLGRRTGIGVVVSGLLRSLAGRPGLEVAGYAMSATGWRDLPPMLPPGVRPGRGPMPAGVLMRAWSRSGHPVGEWWSGTCDVLHGTNYVVPPSRRAARLVSVNDLTAVHYPEMCSPVSLRYPGLVARALATGAHVHTPAAVIAEEVVEHFGADPERVHVVHWGIDLPAPPAKAPAPKTPAAKMPAAKAPAGAPYVLAIGTAEPRKDLPTLVFAWDSVARTHADLRLRLVGPDGWGSAALESAIASAAHRDRIERVGWVADTAAEIEGAAVFAYPSIYEGFGLPPLEAMARGVPVVAAAAGAVPEVVGDAAVLVPPGDAAALAAAIGSLLDDGEHRAAMVAAGVVRAAGFTWERCAGELASLYRRLAEEAPRRRRAR